MGLKTPLHDTHVALGARLVDFGGWDMPLHYGSQIEEHHAVRRDCGMFDVSHMNVLDVKGVQAGEYLRLLLANDVARLKTPGRALYSCMLNTHGGVVDDLIVYYLDDSWYRIVANAGTREKDIAWMQGAAREFSELKVVARDDLSILALQGPRAREKALKALSALPHDAAALKPFHALVAGDMFVATTGYTGEDGFEIVLPAHAVTSVWESLRTAGVRPAGLGARDTLRLEAGMNLYGQDMDENFSPLESGLAWTVSFEPAERHFIGRDALEKQRSAGMAKKLVGLLLEGKGVLRNHQAVFFDTGHGEITSGSFSPTLERSIALARVPAVVDEGARGDVDMRGRREPVRVVPFPFVRNGKNLIQDRLSATATEGR